MATPIEQTELIIGQFKQKEISEEEAIDLIVQTLQTTRAGAKDCLDRGTTNSVHSDTTSPYWLPS